MARGFFVVGSLLRVILNTTVDGHNRKPRTFTIRGSSSNQCRFCGRVWGIRPGIRKDARSIPTRCAGKSPALDHPVEILFDVQYENRRVESPIDVLVYADDSHVLDVRAGMLHLIPNLLDCVEIRAAARREEFELDRPGRLLDDQVARFLGRSAGGLPDRLRSSS